MEFSNDMELQGGGNSRQLFMNFPKVPNVLALMAMDTITISSQGNLLEVDSTIDMK